MASSTAHSAIHRFLLIHRYLRSYARQADVGGLRPRQISVLHFIVTQQQVTVGEVQEYIYSSPSTASAVISELEGSGFVTRSRSLEDNRVVLVEPTAAGQALIRHTPPAGILLLRQRLTELPEARLVTIDAALAELMALMEVPEES